jgi:hypothetical protein
MISIRGEGGALLPLPRSGGGVGRGLVHVPETFRASPEFRSTGGALGGRDACA